MISFKAIVSFFLLLFVQLSSPMQAQLNPMKRAFSALEEYDYFKARKIFLKKQNRHPVASKFGLAKIYSVELNPFFNLDEAYQKAYASERLYKLLTPKKQAKLIRYGIDSTSYQMLFSQIYEDAFRRAMQKNTIAAYNHYINHYSGTPFAGAALTLRNHLAFLQADSIGTSQAYAAFMEQYPDADDYIEAKKKYEKVLYNEETDDNSIESFAQFIAKYPESPYRQQAEDLIYNMMTEDGSIMSYHNFIKRFPDNRNVNDAWEQIYNLYIDDFSPQKLAAFKQDFPDYPFQDKVMQDITLSRKTFLVAVRNGKSGYIDENGKEMLPFIFDDADSFSENLAAVRKDGKYGFINKSGKWVIEAEFESAEPFRNDLSIVKKDGYYGLINKKGEFVVPPAYDDIYDFQEDIALVILDNKFGYVNRQGQLVHEVEFDEAAPFSEGMAAVAKDEKGGFINEQGKLVIPLQYESVGSFRSGISKVELDGKFGLINKEGKILLPIKYDAIGELSEDLMIVALKNKCGYVNTSGKLVIPINLECSVDALSIHSFSDGMAVTNKGKLRGFIGKNGKVLINPSFQDAQPFSEGLAAVRKNNKWGYINKQGKLVIPHQFERAGTFIQGRAIVQKDGKFGLIDSQGKEVVKSDKTQILLFRNGLFLIDVNQKKGLVDQDGREVLPVEFDRISATESYDILKVSRNQKLGFYHLSLKRFIFKEDGF